MKSISNIQSVFVFFVVLILLLYSAAQAQTSLRVKVLDKSTREEIPFSPVELINKKDTLATVTDMDGNAVFRDIIPGKYSIQAKCISYQNLLLTDVPVLSEKMNEVTAYMKPSTVSLEEVLCVEYKVPLIDLSAISGCIITREDFTSMPTKNVLSVACKTAGIYSADEGREVTVRGGRTSSGETDIYIDGVKVRGGTDDYEPACKRIPSKIESVHEVEVELPAASTLTAIEVNDFSKWGLWKNLSKEELSKWSDHWTIEPEDRYTVQLINKSGRAVCDATVKLSTASGEILWTAQTDNSGKAELWGTLESDIVKSRKDLLINYMGKEFRKESAIGFEKGINQIKLDVECEQILKADIVFVVDATGSMGDEIRYIQAELNQIMKKSVQTNPDINIRLGSVFYRDHGDEYLTRFTDLNSNYEQTISFIKKQYAAGGGDGPEAVEEALEVALNDLTWSEEAVSRMMFFILDASPHHTPEIIARLKRQMKAAAEKGIRIIPVMASGGSKDTEYLMRAVALATNGTYLALTDHSGVGNPHMKPSTDVADVVLLNDLICSIINRNISTVSCEPALSQATKKDTAIIDLAVITTEIIDSSLIQRQYNTVSMDTIKSTLSSMDKKTGDDSELFQVMYYPNPVSDFLTIEAKAEEELRVFLSDESGKILQMVNLNGSSRIDLTGYPSGSYQLIFEYKDLRRAGKVIKL